MSAVLWYQKAMITYSYESKIRMKKIDLENCSENFLTSLVGAGVGGSVGLAVGSAVVGAFVG